MSTVNERGCYISRSITDIHQVDIPLCDAIIKEFDPVSVVDIGCGNGGYVKHFIGNGIRAKGFDGSPLTPEISNGLCQIKDFSEPQELGKFDLVLSLEVGEHIPEQYEQVFLDNVCNASSEYLVLSWAIVGQCGLPGEHVNCRNNDYVIAEVEKRDFRFLPTPTKVLRQKSTFEYFKNTVMAFARW